MPPKTARNKVMDFLARRGYSRLELQQKLGRDYSAEEVEEALNFAQENGWMTEPNELSERVTEELHRKLKGHLFIIQYLRQKGLPAVPRDDEEEQRKALEFIERKLAKTQSFDYEEKQKIHRWLASRGFEDDTIRNVLNKKT